LLQLLAEFGAVGAAAGLGFLVWGAWSVFKSRSQIDAHQLLLLIWIAVLLTYSMLEFPLWYMHFLILFGLSFGLLIFPDTGRGVHIARARTVMGAAVLLLLAGCAYTAYDYRKTERGFTLVTIAQVTSSIRTPQFGSMLDEISSDTHLYRLHLEYALGTVTSMTKEDLQSKLRENERLTKRIPLPAPVARQIMLLTLAGDLDGARWYLHRLLKFSPPETTEAVGDMRRLVKEMPGSFAPLAPILDEELAAAAESGS